MKNIVSFKRLTGLFILVVTISCLSSIVAKAKFDDLPPALPHTTTSSYIRLSTIGDDAGTGGHDYAPSLSILVYKDSASVPGTAHLHFNTGDSCVGASLKYRSVRADDSGSQTNSFGAWSSDTEMNPSHNNKSTQVCDDTVDIPSSSFRTSQKFGGTIQVAILRMELTNSGVFTFSVGRDKASDRIRLGTIGVNSNSATITSTNPPRSYGTLLKVRGNGTSMIAKFGVPCNFNTPTNPDPQNGYRRIFWKGADSQTDINPGKVGIDVVGGLGIYTNDDAGKGSGVESSFPTKMSAGDKFTVTFTGLKSKGNNAILLWLPFDSAIYDVDCEPESVDNGWQVSWASSLVRRTDGLSFGLKAGNLSDPGDAAAPEPGQSFQFINDARNGGDREITNLRWTKLCTRTSNIGTGKCHDTPNRWLSNSYQVRNTGYRPYADPIQNHSAFTSNTQTIAFDRGRTGHADDTIGHLGTNAGANTYINGPGWVWDTFNVGAGDGGRTYCVNASFWPSKGTGNTTPGVGTTSWTVDNTRIHAPQLCVQVPYFYDLTPTISGVSGNTQQGDTVNVTGRVSNPGATAGRNHTNSRAQSRGVVEFVLAPNTADPNIAATNNVAQNPCSWVAARVSAAGCSRRADMGQVVPASGSITVNHNRTGTENLSVGTKLCYATYVNHAQNMDANDEANGASLWSYSTALCTVIVKAPKVQFENGDVTVGRYRSDGQVHTNGTVTSACEPPVAGASISASGAPGIVSARANPHLYGSWAEYGGFATGTITEFGTGAIPFGIGMNTNTGARKLMFTNTDDGLFTYGGQCLQNPFDRVKTANTTNLITQTPQAFDSSGKLQLNELAEKYSSSLDKTGYVSQGRNIDIAQPSSDIPLTSVKVVAKSKFATGNSGCPKLRIVASEGTTTDQDTKGICSTSFDTFDYLFNMNTIGPRNINAQFVNDAWSVAGPSEANRDIVIQSIEVNGEEVYKYNAGSPNVSILGTVGPDSGSCNSNAENGLYLPADAIAASSNGVNYCYGLNIANINAPVTEDPDHGPYNPIPAKTTITVSAYALSTNNYTNGASTANGCPQMYITVESKAGGVNRGDVQPVCSSGWQNYTFTTNLGGKGIQSLEVGYDPPDAYGSTGTRDLFVRSIRVNGTSYSTTRTSSIDLRSVPSYKAPTDSTIDQCTTPADRISMYAAQDSASGYHCVGVRLLNIANPPPPAPPASVLDGDYDNFKGRNILIYSKKDNPGDACSPTSNGNLRISQNIAYKKSGFTNVSQLPHLIFMADCNITIADNVTVVNASLIAGDAIKTCNQKSETISQCNRNLRVRGSLSANRLLLWRTYGADLVDTAAAQTPAESFNLSPAQMVAGYSRGLRSAKPTTVYEVDLPPRY